MRRLSGQRRGAMRGEACTRAMARARQRDVGGNAVFMKGRGGGSLAGFADGVWLMCRGGGLGGVPAPVAGIGRAVSGAVSSGRRPACGSRPHCSGEPGTHRKRKATATLRSPWPCDSMVTSMALRVWSKGFRVEGRLMMNRIEAEGFHRLSAQIEPRAGRCGHARAHAGNRLLIVRAISCSAACMVRYALL